MMTLKHLKELGFCDYHPLVVIAKDEETVHRFFEKFNPYCFDISFDFEGKLKMGIFDSTFSKPDFERFIIKNGFDGKVGLFQSIHENITVDSLLDKISNTGYESLSLREKRFLDAQKTYFK